MSQLIILGNGFDLACGLKSKFTDFSTWRQSQVNCCNLSDPKLNAYDIILDEHDGDTALWSDIESAMQALFVGKDSRKPIVNQIYETPNIGAYDLNTGKSKTGKEPRHPLYRFAKIKLKSFDGISREHFIHFLREELSCYEQIFGKYLQQEVDNKGLGYLTKAQNTLHRLADDNVLDEVDGHWTNAVLSFNYTTPFTSSKSIFENTSFYNIHGTLKNGSIIFGIDGQNVGDADMGLPFTKTYRLLSMKPLGYRSLVYPPTDEGHAPTNCIKIYGHSLAQADYSYFQSLFDAVSLYDGITTLVFYYSLYGEGSEAEQEHRIREDLHKRVMHLLTSYGQTLENKDHGKNLVHKLLLEGRLIIKRIDIG